ncbi:Fic family protein [Mesorhizobium amorphae]|uniref:Fic family protein n=1 Tax=Mesorhizobium amorphae TaxID=71433 RepID=UPI003F4F62BF
MRRLQKVVSGIAFDQGPAQNLDAVVAAAIFAFGFVYIHPFEDGNGRIHRYLIHHVLAMHRFNRREWCFPSRPRSWTRSTSRGVCWRAIRSAFCHWSNGNRRRNSTSGC